MKLLIAIKRRHQAFFISIPYDMNHFVPKIYIKVTNSNIIIVSSNKNTFCCAKNPTKDKTFCYVEANEKKTNITKTCLVSNKGINKKKKKRRLNNNNTKSKSNVMVKK